MGVIVFCSGKGSPGATSLAVAVAARWPDEHAPLLVEADPAGGDLAARFGLVPAPGMASAAALGRHAADGQVVERHAQRLPLNVPVLLAPGSARQAAAAVQAVAAAGLVTTVGRVRPVVVDVGRLDESSVAVPIAAAADLVLVVVRPRLDEVAHAAATVTALRSAGAGQVGLVLRAGGDLPAKQIAADLDAGVVGELPTDRWGARVLGGQLVAGPGWRWLVAFRSARSLALAIVQSWPQLTMTSGSSLRAGA